MSLWNLTVAHPSPSFMYTPLDKWSYEQRGSTRRSTFRSALLSFNFSGTGVALHGYITGTYDIELDDTSFPRSTPPSEEVLFKSNGLQPGSHEITLRLGPSSVLDFREAVVFFPNVEDRDPRRVRYDNNNSSALAYSTGWSIASAKGIPNDTATIPYHTTSLSEASVSFTFRDALAIEVSGMLDPTSGHYSVRLSDGNEALHQPAVSALFPDATLFFQTGLSPSKEYELILTNKDGNNGVLSLNSVTLLQYPSLMESPGHSPELDSNGKHAEASMTTGHLVAVILGSIMGAVVLGVVAFALRKRMSMGGPGQSMSWVTVLSRSSSSHAPSNDISARQRAHSSFYQTDRVHNRHSSPQSGFGTEVHQPTEIFDPFSSPGPSANHSAADLLASSASVNTCVIVTNDPTGATVMFWSPSNRFLESASTPTDCENPHCGSTMCEPTSGSDLSAIASCSPAPLLSDFSPSSSRPLLPSPSRASPEPSVNPLPATSALTTQRTSLKRPIYRVLPPLPVPPTSPSAAAEEHPLIEMDAGRLDERYFDGSQTASGTVGPSSAMLLRSSSPPPSYQQ